MKLPTRLSELIAPDNVINALVLKALGIIEPWTLDNKTVFFHEYTDHGLKHLNEVLLTAEGLMSDESWDHLSPQDGALIVLSVLLHDCALHLSEDGFYALINGNYIPGRSRYVNKEPEWPALWEQFFAEAKRFDQRRLESLFGDNQPIQVFPKNKIDLTLKHRMLVGEFLRRHHARLAHEIALSGIPGPGVPVLLADGDGNDFMDLAGFVARSHNMSIRAAVDALEPTQRRVHQNCKVPFLMMVLRISDYIQIHSSRAPGQLLRLKSLVSPISRGEWRKHLAVREINQAHDDPEAIFVDCEPETAATFLSMQRLLSDIQNELDKSWALLGEVYGRFKPLNSLGITIRRVKSNIDNPDLFARTRRPSYLPKEFKFKTSSAELLDLLVEPLYGRKPEIGIRELVQNSVDACLERDDLIEKGLVLSPAKLTEDVVVSLIGTKNSKKKVVVEDFGIGMTAEVVNKYFLNIGASFRSSDVWRKNHEIEGHATIRRTGRFGIGLLAAFLLGPEIKITTRSINDGEDAAITFTCRQGDDSIEVGTCVFHSGTRIEIEISDAVYEWLVEDVEKWDWFCLSRPKVRRIIQNDQEVDISQGYEVPECESKIDATKWRRIFSEGYDDIIWSYEALTRWNSVDPIVICNGIRICRYSSRVTPGISNVLDFIRPGAISLVVFDPDGRFPINLERDQVVSNITGFEKPLALDVSDYFVTKIVAVFEHLNAGITKENVQLSIQPQINGLTRSGGRDGGLAFVLLSKNGILPADAEIIRESGVTSVLIDAVNLSTGRGAFTSPTVLAWADFYIARDGVSKTKSSRMEFVRGSIGGLDYKGDATGYFDPIGIVGRRILLRKSDVLELVKPGNITKSQWSRMSLEVDLGDWGLWYSGVPPELNINLVNVCAELDFSESFGFSLIYFKTNDPKAALAVSSPFAETWRRIVRTPILKQNPR